MATKKTSQKNTILLRKDKQMVYLAIGILIIAILLAFFKVNKNYFMKKGMMKKDAPMQQSASLPSLFETLTKTYPEGLPWPVLGSRQAYQFFPNEIKGLTVAVDEVGEIVDNQYNPLTVLNLSKEISIPLKKAYETYYVIPEVLASQFNISKDEIVFPVGVKVYEFDRALTATEMTAMKSPDVINCFNQKNKISKDVYSNEDVVIQWCDLNPTAEQQEKIKDLYDYVYFLYFTKRNILVQFKVNTKYISSPESYLNDYLSKLFNTNTSLFVKENQIQNAKQRREFEEWRQKTFDR